MISRRSFLETLGIGATGIIFASALPRNGLWLIPENVVAYDGPANLEWFMAEFSAALAANLDHRQFHYVSEQDRVSLLPKMRQFGIDMNFSPEEFQRFRQEMRTIWIEPAMHRLAEEIKFLKPMTCMKLPIPSGCDTNCARITNKAHGFDLRFIRAWDIGSIEYEDIDENGKAYVIPASPPRWINRFDIAVA